jgi:predicted transposase YdaD
MRTDTIFYQLFLTFHSLLFELLGQPLEKAEHYKFTEEGNREQGTGNREQIRNTHLHQFRASVKKKMFF